MNVFILNTGRCGSSTFIAACQHIQNYSSAHESLSTKTGAHRLAYPDNHIEADNRLSWFLGKLDNKYADNAFYVHLKRNKQQTTESFIKRKDYGIMRAYKEGILLGGEQTQTPADIAEDYIDTIETNIRLFLKDKTQKMEFSLENPEHDFATFLTKISAQCDINKAMNEWKINHNKS